MKRLVLLTFMMLASVLAVNAQKKVALLETRVGEGSTAASGMEKAMVRGELRKAITNHEGYEAFTRGDIDQIMTEQGFQRTGMVSEDQIKELGVMSGADYICVSTLTKSNNEFYLEAYLINVESAQISNPASQYGELTGGKLANMFPICQALAQELIGGIRPSAIQGSNASSISNRPAAKNADVITITVGGVSFEMIRVEGGTFQMGATSEQGSDAEGDEKPVHSVTLSNYYIGETEVTQALWKAVMGKNPSYFKGDNIPVEQVSWMDCQEFIRKLNQQTGKNFRLPTEAEWEYAARGGKKSRGYKYSGSNYIGDVAWYEGNKPGGTRIVKTKSKNELGLYDMTGNVWEWCQDWYGSYSMHSQTNPQGPSSGTGRVVRGGSWNHYAKYSRVSDRGVTDPVNRDYYGGFRLCLSE